MTDLSKVDAKTKTYVFVQKGKNEFSGLFDKLLTDQEISNLPGPSCAVLIMNPHLEKPDESSVEPLTANLPFDKGEN